MNNVRSIERLNEYELECISRDGSSRGSWHDEYKDSAVVFVGGLDSALTEGDVLTIFSQYGEIVDINLPRHTAQQQQRQLEREGSTATQGQSSQVGKRRGFGFLLYEDQRSTILAVDNLNGAKVLGKTLRVDHVKDYKHLEKDQETGKMREAEKARANAKPQIRQQAPECSDRRSRSITPPPEIDPEDPMASYIANQKKERVRSVEDGDGASDARSHGSRTIRAAAREAKRQRKEERAKIRVEREQRRSRRKERGAGNQNSEDESNDGRSSSRRTDEKSRSKPINRDTVRHERDKDGIGRQRHDIHSFNHDRY